MLSVVLAVFGALVTEVSTSLGKFAVGHKWEHPSVMGLMNSLWTLVYFLAIAVVSPVSFVIVSSTVTLLVIVAVLNILQTLATVHAIQLASRSTFGLIRALTIPLIVGIDAILGVNVSSVKITVMVVMFAAIAWLYRNHGFSPRGSLVTLFTAVNAAITISTLKYILDQGTSIVAAQIIFITSATVVLAVWAGRHMKRKNITKHGKILAVQSLTYGLGGLIESYALVFAPASVVTTASRAAAVLWAIICGQAVFHERHVREKIIAGTVIAIGLCVLAFGP